MRTKVVTLSEILNLLGDNVLRVEGKQEGVYIDNLADVANVNETTLDWINPQKPDKQQIAEKSKAKVLLVDDTIKPIEGKTLIVVQNPKVALALVGNEFFTRKYQPGIHPTAIVSSGAKIGDGVYIGPYCVVDEAEIGDGCIIESNVRIYGCVTIGKNCRIKSGAILGGEGFGFEKDSDGNRFRFPQIGSLIIGDYVEIGGNTCIDRGALSDTIIGDYTKINNLCHIAHNNTIGKNVEITGCVNVSGGNIIEDNVWLAPNSSVRGYIHIGERAVLGMGAVATKDIPSGETWVGNPARKMEKK